jgi:hypothetical protein
MTGLRLNGGYDFSRSCAWARRGVVVFVGFGWDSARTMWSLMGLMGLKKGLRWAMGWAMGKTRVMVSNWGFFDQKNPNEIIHGY